MIKKNNKKRIKNLLAQIINTFSNGYAKISSLITLILAYSIEVSQGELDEKYVQKGDRIWKKTYRNM